MGKRTLEERNISEDSLGAINIAPTVIENIAQEAAGQVKGLELAAWYGSGWRNFTSGKNTLLYQTDEGELVLEIAVNAYYGIDVPAATLALQRHVKEQILYMTDISVDRINVRVIDLVKSKDEKTEEE